MRKLAVVVELDPEHGRYVATVPGLPGVVGWGETREEALEDAVKATLEAVSEDSEVLANNNEGASPLSSFDARPDLESLAAKQGVAHTTDFDDLLGDFWPEDESADEFVAVLREWRRERWDAWDDSR